VTTGSPTRYGASYDPWLPWGGVRGSPCGDRNLQRERQAMTPGGPAELGFPDLADCRECPMCGGCMAHYGCTTDWDHMAWYAQFAAPGEPACGAEGTVAGRPGFACELPRGHGGDLHKDTRGNGWGASGAGGS
jgi:hypothetical protein